jgi:hypothetical protein
MAGLENKASIKAKQKKIQINYPYHVLQFLIVDWPHEYVCLQRMT